MARPGPAKTKPVVGPKNPRQSVTQVRAPLCCFNNPAAYETGFSIKKLSAFIGSLDAPRRRSLTTTCKALLLFYRRHTLRARSAVHGILLGVRRSSRYPTRCCWRFRFSFPCYTLDRNGIVVSKPRTSNALTTVTFRPRSVIVVTFNLIDERPCLCLQDSPTRGARRFPERCRLPRIRLTWPTAAVRRRSNTRTSPTFSRTAGRPLR